MVSPFLCRPRVRFPNLNLLYLVVTKLLSFNQCLGPEVVDLYTLIVRGSTSPFAGTVRFRTFFPTVTVLTRKSA